RRREPACAKQASGFGLDLEDRAALVHAGLEIDVVRTPQFAGILVLDIGRALEGIRRTAHAAPGRRRFLLWHGHDGDLLEPTARCAEPISLREAGLIEEGAA